MTVITVAAAQIACVAGDVGANLDLHLAALAEAGRRGVDLLVFPELSLADYVSEPDADRVALAADGPELARLAAAAPGAVIVAGFVERTAAGRPHNAGAVLAGGRVVHVHRKLNLPTYGALVEGRHYAPGTRLGLAPTRLGPLATLVCADTWNPALPWLAALAGAALVAVPIASARGAVSDLFDSRDGWTVNLRHTAISYGLPVVMANHCGRRGGLDFWGGSAIFDGHGREVARAGDGPELLVADIDLDDARRARAELPTVRDADPALVRRELERLLDDPDPSLPQAPRPAAATSPAGVGGRSASPGEGGPGRVAPTPLAPHASRPTPPGEGSNGDTARLP